MLEEQLRDEVERIIGRLVIEKTILLLKLEEAQAAARGAADESTEPSPAP